MTPASRSSSPQIGIAPTPRSRICSGCGHQRVGRPHAGASSVISSRAVVMAASSSLPGRPSRPQCPPGSASHPRPAGERRQPSRSGVRSPPGRPPWSTTDCARSRSLRFCWLDRCTEHLEGLLHREPVGGHQDALGHADEVSALHRGLEAGHQAGAAQGVGGVDRVDESQVHVVGPERVRLRGVEVQRTDVLRLGRQPDRQDRADAELRDSRSPTRPAASVATASAR